MTRLDELTAGVRARLLDRTDSEAARLSSDSPELREQIRGLIAEQAMPLAEADLERLVEEVLSATVGLGPLEKLMADGSVDEIMVNGPQVVLVERAGRIESTDVCFGSEEELRHVIERILSPVGRRVDEASPLADARLADGSRVNCVIPPLSLDGPLLTIRRFRRQGFSAADLVESGSVDRTVCELLERCVRSRLNVVVSGATGSGKTTLLNVLSSFIGSDERVITIEDAAELRLAQRHVLRLEARPPNLEGRGEVTIRQLVRNALRMRPDRLIVGEVRGAEALDMLQALNTGHDGSMTTVHANSASDALRRIETLALMAEIGLPHVAVREQLASAFDLVVHLIRERGGRRCVSELVEVSRSGRQVGTRPVFRRGDRTVNLGDALTHRLEGASR